MDDSSSSLPSTPTNQPVPSTRGGTEHYTVFMGPNGLRAGWRLSIFAAMFGVPYLILTWLGKLMSGGHAGPAPQGLENPLIVAVGEFIAFGFFVLISGIMGLIENRSYEHYGLPWRSPFPKNFWVGLFWGFASISALMGMIAAGHGFQIVGLQNHGRAAAVYGAEWALAFLFVGFFEEFFFRGYMLFTLTTGIGFWPAAFVCAGIFGYAHTGNQGETAFGIAQVVFFGLFAALVLRRTGSLWWPIGFHAAWDWGQTYFYGVPDSGLPATSALLRTEFHGSKWLTGGSTGPEASVCCLVVLIISTALVAWRYKAVHYPDRTALGPRPRDQEPTAVSVLP